MLIVIRHGGKKGDRCASNPPESRNNMDVEVGVTSGDLQLLMSFECKNTAIDPEELNQSDVQKNLSLYPEPESPRVLLEASEQKEIQFAADEDKIQATEARSDDEMPRFPETPDKSEEYLPEASDTTEAEPERGVKQEHEDVAVTTEEEEERGVGHLQETQACQPSGESVGAQLKPEDSELHEAEESFQTYFSSVRSQITPSRLVNVASTERLKQEDLPLRACSVRLQRAEILQRPRIQSKRLHVCSVCDRLFIYKRTLRRHRRLHSGERPRGRWLCSKAFLLRRHKKDPFSCSQCGQRFRRWRKLRLHWRSHAGESPFMCRRCGKHCRSLKSLDRHLAYVQHD